MNPSLVPVQMVRELLRALPREKKSDTWLGLVPSLPQDLVTRSAVTRYVNYAGFCPQVLPAPGSPRHHLLVAAGTHAHL